MIRKENLIAMLSNHLKQENKVKQKKRKRKVS